MNATNYLVIFGGLTIVAVAILFLSKFFIAWLSLPWTIKNGIESINQRLDRVNERLGSAEITRESVDQ